MRRSTLSAAPLAVAMILVLAAVAVARAETWSLELKQLKAASRHRSSSQRFYAQVGDKEKSRLRFPGVEEQTAAFKRIVNKEPEYESKVPLRGVAKLGSQEYAFAVDAVPPKSPAEIDPDSAVAKLAEKLFQALPLPPTYNRLYFDFNCNGDLTDDEAVEAKSLPNNPAVLFPRIDIVLDVDGAKLDYSFFLSTGGVYDSEDFNYAMASLNAAVLRKGDVTLEGKKHRITLIDLNSNGRFDDQTTFPASRQTPGVLLDHLQPGDALLVDVDPDKCRMHRRSPYAAAKNNQLPMSKLIELDDRFYDMKVSPTGDQITLTPASVRLGRLTNPHDGFCATIYGNKGFLKIDGNKDVPEGQWKLLSYKINLPDYWKSIPPPKEKQKEGVALLALTDSLEATLSSRPRYTYVRAQATTDCKPVVVRAGETVMLPFGPPLTLLVTAGALSPDKKQLPLSLSVIGSGGERCTHIMVDGNRPSKKPEFTITDPEGNVVHRGNFEYG